MPSTRKGQQVSKVLYVGNLPFWSTEADLGDLFGRHGIVDSVNVIADRETGRPQGFAFVEMEEANAADNATRALDGSDFAERDLEVHEARNRPRRKRLIRSRDSAPCDGSK